MLGSQGFFSTAPGWGLLSGSTIMISATVAIAITDPYNNWFYKKSISTCALLAKKKL